MYGNLGRKTAFAAAMVSTTTRTSFHWCCYVLRRVYPMTNVHAAPTRSPLAPTSRTFNTIARMNIWSVEFMTSDDQTMEVQHITVEPGPGTEPGSATMLRMELGPNSTSKASSRASMVKEGSTKIIDGNSVARDIRDEIATEISKMKESSGVVPGLGVILVGDRKDSATYVENKKIACEAVGINSYNVHLPEDSSEQEVLKYISGFNDDPSVNGILVQLPLPSHMNEQNILNAVHVEKDVDGLNPLNIGLLAMLDREPLFVPCTPKGCIELLHRYGFSIEGKRAVVIGRSNIVGLPAALLLQREYATVTVIQPGTKNPEEVTREADILISAVGRPHMVRGSWIKHGAVVIDVGINPVKDNTSPRGYRMVGDVCFEEASKIASAITPVPGGVGPMTIAMLLSNTLSSAKRANKCFQNGTRSSNAIKNWSTLWSETSCKTGGTKNR